MRLHSDSDGVKAQSAMEYLMTYGWAILIIAIVLAALFQLGVFSSNTFAPKASPGSCQVFRPNGPGSTQFINTEGVCNGELPQYVANFNAAGGGITLSPMMEPQDYTAVLWFNTGAISTSENPLLMFWGAYNARVEINPTTNTIYFERDAGGSVDSGIKPAVGQWYQVVVVLASSKAASIYVNGVLENTGSTPTGTEIWYTNDFIGHDGDFGYNFNGSIANVQIYNTSLSQPEITALYQEGIGGAPIDLQHLVGWWPLNGNAHDYSGNNNNGQTNGGVTFTSSWENGYTPP